MVGITEISAGLASLKAAKDMLQGIDATRTGAAIGEVRIELQRLILEAQASLSAAREAESAAARRIADLEQEIVRLKDWSAEKARYEPVDIHLGSIAYMPKIGREGGQPPHWLCANCFERGQKSFLQFKGQAATQAGSRGLEARYGCDACGAAVMVSYRRSPESVHETRLAQAQSHAPPGASP